jgi:hypothetical protein
VQFSDAPGYMRETSHDAVMERVDEHGNVLGFSILGVSRCYREHPVEMDLAIDNLPFKKAPWAA